MKKKIKSASELITILSKAVPGDTIKIANGTWTDVNLVLEANGTLEKPITIMAEEPGKFFIEGKSSLRIAGEYLVINGFYFRNGKTTEEAVIIYRKNLEKLANNCRITNCVIENYNQDDRFKMDSWVVLYGKNNRFDHNYLGGKLNSGVTLIVGLNDEKNRENFHKIDHNYFGERPQLGSNGGETIRVGVANYSLFSSNTIIENNYFEHCSGETEILSIKACDNIIRNNTFFECQGALVLRHGNRNLVEGNYFIGNGKPNTGGIRVINKGHIIRNNYFQNLAGDRFRAALSIMNGVPNSAINRYHQVEDVLIENNTFINCDNIEFAAGSDNERTAVPIKTIIKNNMFYNPNKDEIFKEHDDISGIEFQQNEFVNKSGKFNSAGFVKSNKKFDLNKNGLWGISDFIPKLPASEKNTGADWFKSKTHEEIFDQKIIEVAEGIDGLAEAIKKSKPNDIVKFIKEGTYLLTNTISIKHPLTIIADEKLKSRPIMKIKNQEDEIAFLSIENGGSLTINGIAFDGTSELGISSYAIRTSEAPMIDHYNLYVENCEFYNFNESKFSAFKSFKSTFADSIKFIDCIFHSMSGAAINLATEKEDAGKYNADLVIIKNCLFYDVMGEALDLYRGGNDESTWGPDLRLVHCTFENVNNKELGSVLRLIGVQEAVIEKNLFSNSGKGGRVIKFEDPRWANIIIKNCNLFNSGRIETYYKDRVGEGITQIKPDYENPEESNYNLKKNSPLFGVLGYNQK